nr:IPT/TIG domain-containing protein [Raineyella fluvialis]
MPSPAGITATQAPSTQARAVTSDPTSPTTPTTSPSDHASPRADASTVHGPAGGSANSTQSHRATQSPVAPSGENNNSTHKSPVPAPVVSGLSPAEGDVGGGVKVTISGQNLTGATGVTFGGVAGTGLTVDSATSLTVVAPAHAAGVVDVVVQTPGGQATKTGSFTYKVPPVPAPVVSGLSPAEGDVGGGVKVTISGQNLTGATGVTFGGVAGTGLTVDSATSLTVVAPAHAAGVVDVVVQTPGGQATKTGSFTYKVPPVPAPVVSGLSPAEGDVGGGVKVTISGQNLTGATGVTFGGVAGTGLTVDSATSLTVVAPAHAAGVVDVVVQTPGGQATKTGSFTYKVPPVPAPVVSGLSPAEGDVGGGVKVTISGQNLTGATGVTFGGVAGTGLTVDSATSLTVVAPAHAAGVVDVVVQTPGGQATKTGSFTYKVPPVPAPVVSGLSPAEGDVGGGVKVTISGQNLTGATGVTFGGVAGTGLTVDSATSLTVVAPAHAAGVVDVVVQTPGGQATKTGSFTYKVPPVPAPVVSGLSPAEGDVGGGVKVTISGQNLTGATGVTFGGVAGTGLTVDSATSLTVVAPAHAAGVVDVVVQTPGGQATKTGSFTYKVPPVPAPVVSGLSPAEGDVGGGVKVTISGQNLTGATGVTFGGVAGTGLTVDSATSLTVVAPAHAAGVVDVVVQTPGGQATKTGSFTYKVPPVPAPVVSGLSPAEGDVGGGVKVTISGQNLTGATGVTFGGVAGTGLTVDSATSLTVVAPAHAAGVVDVVVQTPGGQATKTGSFTYKVPPVPAPVVSGLSPAEGDVGGGVKVTISGQNLTGATGVTFGGVAGTGLTVDSATSLTVVAPAHAAGVVDVVVQTPGGQATKTGSFTYKVPPVPAPVVSGLSPAEGDVGGGVKVTISGQNLTGATGVTFGGVAGTGLTVDSATSLTVVAPAHAAGVVDVVVQTPGGQATKTGSFTYKVPPVPAPVVSGLSPAEGDVGGGVKVTISGQNLTGATGVTFGGVAGTGLTVDSATSLTVVAPAHAAGVVDVVVQTPGGQATKTGSFTYKVPPVPAPVVSGLSPAEGDVGGGVKVTISGQNLTGATGVTFGGVAGTGLTVDSATSLTVVAPAHAAGVVDVVVQTPGGQATKTGSFTYTCVKQIIRVSGSLTSDTTWTSDCAIAYVSDGTFNVPRGVTLTIAPGVIVKGGFWASGTLNAVGTVDHPIIFTSVTDDTAGGATGGYGTTPKNQGAVMTPGGNVVINMAHVVIDHTDQVFASSLSTDLSHSTLTLTDNTIHARVNVYSAPRPVIQRNTIAPTTGGWGLDLYRVGDITGVPFTGPDVNTLQGTPNQRMVSLKEAHSLAGTKVTLSNDGGVSAYNVTNMYQQGELTIAPGVILKGDGNDGFWASGTLNAVGTVDHPIIFTSVTDDTAGGATGGYGTTPKNQGAVMTPGGNVVINMAHVVIDHTDQVFASSLSTDLSHSTLTLTDNTIHARVNVYSAPRPVIQRNTIAPTTGGWGLDLYRVGDITGVPFTGPDVNTLQGTPNQRMVSLKEAHSLAGTKVTLSNDGGVSAYNVTNMYQQGELTIAPGVILKGDGNDGFWASGTLNAVGTVDHPIIFTSVTDDTAGGATGGYGTTPKNQGAVMTPGGNVVINMAHVVIDHTDQVFASSLSTDLSHSTLTLTDNTIHARVNVYSAPRPVIQRNTIAPTTGGWGLDLYRVGDITGVPFTGPDVNTLQGTPNQRMVSLKEAHSLAGTKVTLSNDGGVSAYNVTNMYQQGELTIAPGVILKGDGNDGFWASGTLNAVGTVDHPIIFTSVTDDTAGGATGGYGTTPKNQGAVMTPGGNVVINMAHVVIDHTDQVFASSLSTDLSHSTLTLTDNTIHARVNVYSAPRPVIQRNTIAPTTGGWAWICTELAISPVFRSPGLT